MNNNPANNIIDCQSIADDILTKLAKDINAAKIKSGLNPVLAIILIGNDPASILYIENKSKRATLVGITIKLIKLTTSVSTEEVLSEIAALNNNVSISGIIVQLPLPKHVDVRAVLSAIDPNKDVDGFHPLNIGYLNVGFDEGFVACTALGVLAIIEKVNPNLEGKHCCIIGRSNIVGKPLANLLLNKDCTVTLCHSKTKNLKDISSTCDIVIAAIGKPRFLTQEFFNTNSIVIDVGINRDADSGKLLGDVDFDNVQTHVKYITSVPKGVGPMTIAFLLKNTFKAFLYNNFG